MLRNLVLLTLLLTAGLAVPFLFRAPDQPPPAAPAVPAGTPTNAFPAAPDFSYTRLDGQSGRLTGLRGRFVLLNFWASWCAPCRVEFPQLLTLARQRPEDVTLLAISVDHDRAAMQTFLNGFGELADLPNVIIAHDPQKAVAQDLFQTIRYPETILIGPDLTLRRKFVGLEVRWDSPEFMATLSAAP